MPKAGHVLNYINGQWARSQATASLEVRHPATAALPDRVPLTPAAEVSDMPSVQAARAEWEAMRAKERDYL